MRPTLLLAALGLAACGGAYRDLPDGGSNSAPTCGRQVCDQAPEAACVDSDTLRTYPATCSDRACSYPETDVACGQGCCVDHCCALVPSNSEWFGSIQPNGLVVSPPSGTFNTAAQCTPTSALGACAAASRGTDLGDACVCRADELTIRDLKVTGSRALVLIVARTVVVSGTLDMSSDNDTNGPGASKYFAAQPTESVGGIGGSYGGTGGSGGSSTGIAATYGDPSLVPLLGGMSGQGSGGAGGGGGGALQISAGVSITVDGTINAGGGGGQPGLSPGGQSGAGGGGSGGAVLLEAPAVTLPGSVVANGGGGGGGGGSFGGGGIGGPGWGGALARAEGGAGRDGDGCAGFGNIVGGDGGAGAIAAVAASPGIAAVVDARCQPYPYVGGGGGGGGVGRIRVNTKTLCQCGGTISPSATFGTVSVQ